jgi:hypothetical protein
MNEIEGEMPYDLYEKKKQFLTLNLRILYVFLKV